MHRFYVERQDMADGGVTIEGDVAHQIVRVLRLNVGDTIALFPGDGSEQLVEITSIAGRYVEAKVLGTTHPDTESPGNVELALALIQASKFELVLQKATELGVTAVQPMVCEQSRSSGADRVTPERMRRWSRLLREAAEQSGRVRLPALREPATLRAVLQSDTQALTLLLHPHSEPGGAPWPKFASGTTIRILVGPEGGFTNGEVDAAVAAGAHATRLGCRIMRAETAAIAALALVVAAREGWEPSRPHVRSDATGMHHRARSL